MRLVVIAGGLGTRAKRMQAGTRPSRGATPSTARREVPLASARLLPVWQRRVTNLRAELPAPRETGRKGRLDLCDRRCRRSRSEPRPAQRGGGSVAAQGPSMVPTLVTPMNLSAIKPNHRENQPCLPLGGDRSFEFSGLRSVRTVPPHLVHQMGSGGTQLTLSGASGVDTKSGAAIQCPGAPGE